VAGWFGQGKSYQVQNRDQWQDGVDRVNVIRFGTGTSGRMVWTQQILIPCALAANYVAISGNSLPYRSHFTE